MRIPKRIRSKKDILVLGLKAFALALLYLFVSLYTIPIYHSVKAFVEEKVVTNSKIIIIGDSAITVELADTYEKRVQGLSGREELKKNTGMFFIFDKPDKYGIWMKDMKFALDIIWLDQYGEIIFIEENVSPDTYPKTFVPDKPAAYVLEVNAGFVEEKHLELGDKIDFY